MKNILQTLEAVENNQKKIKAINKEVENLLKLKKTLLDRNEYYLTK